MSKVLVILAICTLLPSALFAADEKPAPDAADVPDAAETTLNAIGDAAPDFTVAMLDGSTFTLSDHRGELVLINWFATWCRPCKAEMPHLQSDVWEKFAKRGLVMVSIAREENSDVVAPFVKEYQVTWPFGLDPERIAYGQYAEAYIPRNVVVGSDGKILYQSSGFEEDDFEAMIALIDEQLPAE